jgi:hypothetical protein
MARDAVNVAISLDASAAVDAISAFIAAIDRPNGVSESLLALAQRAEKLIDEGGAIDFDSLPAAGASELIVRAKPSQAFLGLLAAARAGN